VLSLSLGDRLNADFLSNRECRAGSHLPRDYLPIKHSRWTF
jgi:hypothetical protein